MNFNISEFKNKTRVLITGNEDRKAISGLLLWVIGFLGNEIDFIKENEEKISGCDFVVFELSPDAEKIMEIEPNIAVISTFESQTEQLLKTITAGGIVIFNEEDEALKNAVENAENYFRRIPYKTPAFQIANQTIYLETDLGEVPLSFASEKISFIDAVKHLCQHIGIQQEEFYEALMNFEG